MLPGWICALSTRRYSTLYLVMGAKHGERSSECVLKGACSGCWSFGLLREQICSAHSETVCSNFSLPVWCRCLACQCEVMTRGRNHFVACTDCCAPCSFPFSPSLMQRSVADHSTMSSLPLAPHAASKQQAMELIWHCSMLDSVLKYPHSHASYSPNVLSF